MSAGSGDLFEVTLVDFKSGLTPRQLVDFQFAAGSGEFEKDDEYGSD